MRLISLTVLLIFTGVIQAAWSCQVKPFNVQGPANSHQLTYQDVRIIPKIAAEAGIQEWEITLRCGDEVIGTLTGSGDMAPAYVFPLEKTHLDQMVTAGRLSFAESG